MFAARVTYGFLHGPEQLVLLPHPVKAYPPVVSAFSGGRTIAGQTSSADEQLLRAPRVLGNFLHHVCQLHEVGHVCLVPNALSRPICRIRQLWTQLAHLAPQSADVVVHLLIVHLRLQRLPETIEQPRHPGTKLQQLRLGGPPHILGPSGVVRDDREQFVELAKLLRRVSQRGFMLRLPLRQTYHKKPRPLGLLHTCFLPSLLLHHNVKQLQVPLQIHLQLILLHRGLNQIVQRLPLCTELLRAFCFQSLPHSCPLLALRGHFLNPLGKLRDTLFQCAVMSRSLSLAGALRCVSHRVCNIVRDWSTLNIQLLHPQLLEKCFELLHAALVRKLVPLHQIYVVFHLFGV
mmetsp:Transcript_40810/g.108147  ORF Transcript_40810/g.108147 Transcript_40810/m.108147 type:complete len:347 (+) Transcript_40810:611-1651(+)